MIFLGGVYILDVVRGFLSRDWMEEDRERLCVIEWKGNEYIFLGIGEE